ncbi:hypothetical protein HK104_004021 [Borealophlyctis nickersoniae]|nr:hypothetical protein HK104_004021 [Borealophlyctis nickersoniae]
MITPLTTLFGRSLRHSSFTTPSWKLPTPIIRHFASITETPPLLKQTPADIATRTACTQLLLTRWGIEAAKSNLKEEGKADGELRIRQGYDALNESVKQTGIERHFTDRERSLLSKDLGTWSVQEDMAGLMGKWESFGTLLWALRIIDGIPRYHVHFPRELLFKATAIIPAFPHTVTDFLEYFTNGEGSKEHHRVSEQEFSNAVRKAEAWYWRSQAQIVLDLKQSLEGEGPEKDEARRKIPSSLHTVISNLPRAVSLASSRALSEHLIEESAQEDFAVDGVPYGELDDHLIATTAEIAEARMAAFAWLAKVDEWEVKRGEAKFVNPLGSLWTPEEGAM